MGITGGFKRLFGIDEEEYEDELVEEEEVAEEPADNTFKADFTQNISVQQPITPKKERNVTLSSIPRLQVVLVKPETFEEAIDIADSLNAKKTVVLNLEAANKEVARRLVDFLSGVAYANRGSVQKVASATFLITPYNVDISGIGLMDIAESQGELY